MAISGPFRRILVLASFGETLRLGLMKIKRLPVLVCMCFAVLAAGCNVPVVPVI
jgi:hypothetical protein